MGSAVVSQQVLRMAGFALGSAGSATVLALNTRAGASLPGEQGYVVGALLGAALWAATGVLSVVLAGHSQAQGARHP